MNKLHTYRSTITWSGNRGAGTLDYKSYSRDHDISIEGKPVIRASSDPVYRGDKARYSPEDLLVSSLSGCHMLWYLHLCAINGVVVIDYIDYASGQMEENIDGSGQFTNVTLRPRVTVTGRSMIDKAKALHHDANKMCFIARSVNFPVRHLPEIICDESAGIVRSET
jgi:organic hydroperoxide reductase OsmC/OhrA